MGEFTQYIDKMIRKAKLKHSMEFHHEEIFRLREELDEALAAKERWRQKYWELKRKRDGQERSQANSI